MKKKLDLSKRNERKIYKLLDYSKVSIRNANRRYHPKRFDPVQDYEKMRKRGSVRQAMNRTHSLEYYYFVETNIKYP